MHWVGWVRSVLFGHVVTHYVEFMCLDVGWCVCDGVWVMCVSVCCGVRHVSAAAASAWNHRGVTPR